MSENNQDDPPKTPDWMVNREAAAEQHRADIARTALGQGPLESSKVPPYPISPAKNLIGKQIIRDAYGAGTGSTSQPEYAVGGGGDVGSKENKSTQPPWVAERDLQRPAHEAAIARVGVWQMGQRTEAPNQTTNTELVHVGTGTAVGVEPARKSFSDIINVGTSAKPK